MAGGNGQPGAKKFFLCYQIYTTKGTILGNMVLRTAALTEKAIGKTSAKIGEEHDKQTIANPKLGFRGNMRVIILSVTPLEG